MKAYFIDGKTSKRRDCEIQFRKIDLIITFQGDEGKPGRSLWRVERIHPLDVKTTSLAIRYGDFPHEVLEFLNQEDFDKFLAAFPRAEFHQSAYNTFTTFGWKGIAAALVGVVIVSVLFFIYGAPWLADGIANSIPKEYETYIGENYRYSYLQFQEIDSAKTKEIQAFYDDLEYPSEYDIEVVVVESDMVNAFALPGGYIVVFTGILDMIEDEEELAALLAHEASHINNRHSLRMISRDLSMYVLLASLTGDIGGFSSVIIDNSNMISSLSYSRHFEQDADMEGIKLMIGSNINPAGMVELFEKFEHMHDEVEAELSSHFTSDSTNMELDSDSLIAEESWEEQSLDALTEILSTHPSPENRIKYLREAIEGEQFQSSPERIHEIGIHYDALMLEKLDIHEAQADSLP